MNAPDHVVCVDSSDHPASLKLHRIYQTLPDDEAIRCGDLGALHESGGHYRFPVRNLVAINFVAVSPPQRELSSVLGVADSR